jgi:hypothetical protein
VIEFLDWAISARLENKTTEEAFDEAFITIVSVRISVLKPKEIRKPGLLALLIIRLERMVEVGFEEIDELYSKIAKEIAPKEVIERPVARAETVSVVSYPLPELEELDKLVLSLKAPFIEKVSKEIESADRMI